MNKQKIKNFLFSRNILARLLRRLFWPFKKSLVKFIDLIFEGKTSYFDDSNCYINNEFTLDIHNDNKVKKIVYFVGCPDGESKRYRVFNIVDVLRNFGYSVDVVYESDLNNYRISADLTTAVVFRAKFTKHLQNFIFRLRAAHVDVIFDTDDLVFEPESLEFIGAVRKLDEDQKPWHLNEITQIKRALLMCDAATTSNDFLASRIRNLNVRTEVVRFCLNPLQIDFARILKPKMKIANNIRLGFFSGSPTHQTDFEAMEESLYKFLKINPNYTFVVVGYLDLGERWDHLQDQLERHNFLPPLEMLAIMAEIDCLLVPLEMGNPFTNSKAEVKIFESALVSTPVICSAIYSYAKCITSGVNGILVTDSNGWDEALNITLKSTDLRMLGARAKEDFVPYFNDALAAKEALRFYNQVRSIRLLGIE